MLEVTPEIKGDVIIFRLDGKFDYSGAEEIDDVWKKHISDEYIVVGFECSKLTFVDSSAITHLISYGTEAVNKGIKMVVFGLNDEISELFKSAKLGRFIHVMSEDDFYLEYLS